MLLSRWLVLSKYFLFPLSLHSIICIVFLTFSVLVLLFNPLPSGTLSKRRQRFAQKVTNEIRDGCQKNMVSEKEVLKLVVKYLGLDAEINIPSGFVFRLPFSTRNNAWKFWDANSDESTLTTQLAKLRVADKPKCQLDLEYVSTVELVTIRNRQFYQSIWKVTSIQLLSLYQKYCVDHPDIPVSKGTFFNLKPFYIRDASQKDVEMCLCKLHLHGQWSIKSLLQWVKKVQQQQPQQHVEIDATDYRTFYAKLMKGCPPEHHTHIMDVYTKQRTCV